MAHQLLDSMTKEAQVVMTSYPWNPNYTTNKKIVLDLPAGDQPTADSIKVRLENYEEHLQIDFIKTPKQFHVSVERPYHGIDDILGDHIKTDKAKVQ